jgi:hypothetical protein
MGQRTYLLNLSAICMYVGLCYRVLAPTSATRVLHKIEKNEDMYSYLQYINIKTMDECNLPANAFGDSCTPLQHNECLRWGGMRRMASRFFSKSPETIPLPFNSRKIIPPPFLADLKPSISFLAVRNHSWHYYCFARIQMLICDAWQ